VKQSGLTASIHGFNLFLFTKADIPLTFHDHKLALPLGKSFRLALPYSGSRAELYNWSLVVMQPVPYGLTNSYYGIAPSMSATSHL